MFVVLVFLDEIFKENQLIIHRAYEIMGHIHDTKYGLHMHIYLLFFPHGVEKEKVRLTKR